MALASGACSSGSHPVEILVNGNPEWQSQLGSDALVLDEQLGLGWAKQPPRDIWLHVDSPGSNVELLSFPFEADASFRNIDSCSNVIDCGHVELTVPEGVALGYVHHGGEVDLPIGGLLSVEQPPPPKPVSIRSFYMRRHGECERAVRWKDLLDAIVSQIKSESDCSDQGWLGCFDWTTSFDKRVVTSYLRQVDSIEDLGGRGRGGFGLGLAGDTEFDSPFVCDLEFKASAGYDVVLSDAGFPEVRVSSGPFARAYGCSDSPFFSCHEGDVQDGVKASLAGTVTTRLNDTIEKCLAVPLGLETCTKPSQCVDDISVILLAIAARKEAVDRGATVAHADLIRDALLSEANWRCAPVAPACTGLTGSEPTEGPVCQLELRARDIVPMPDSLSLVWLVNGYGFSEPTAAEALYLGLVELERADDLARLCTPVGSQDVFSDLEFARRSFARVVH